FICSVTTLFTQLRLYLLGTTFALSLSIVTMNRTVFFRLLAHAPEELQREAKEDVRRAIAAFCFTEDDIRRIFEQEDQGDELSDAELEEAITRLLDAWEYEEASKAADYSIAEAVARYLHDLSIERNSGDENLGHASELLDDAGDAIDN